MNPANMPMKAAWARPAPVQGPPTRLAWRTVTPDRAPRPGLRGSDMPHTQQLLPGPRTLSRPSIFEPITEEADGPCDGSHGRFCPECAAVNRWSTS